MSMLKIHRTVKAAVLIGCIGITSSPALAISLDEALRASLENSSAIAAARQSWLATREAIGTNTSTTDLKARLNATSSVGQPNSWRLTALSDQLLMYSCQWLRALQASFAVPQQSPKNFPDWRAAPRQAIWLMLVMKLSRCIQ